LDASFREDERIAQAFGGEVPFKVMTALATGAEAISKARQADWLRDPPTFGETLSQWLVFLNQLQPEIISNYGPGSGSRRSLLDYIEAYGPKRAADMLRTLADKLDRRPGADVRASIEEAFEQVLHRAKSWSR
jgi:hypothetical protein